MHLTHMQGRAAVRFGSHSGLESTCRHRNRTKITIRTVSLFKRANPDLLFQEGDIGVVWCVCVGGLVGGCLWSLGVLVTNERTNDQNCYLTEP